MALSGIALVTGGAGFIGSHIAAALVASGAKLRIIDDLSTGYRENLEELKGENLEERLKESSLRYQLLESQYERQSIDLIEIKTKLLILILINEIYNLIS